MPEYNWKDSLDFHFYDFYDRSDVDLIYIDEENPSSIALKFEIRNQSGIELVLEAYKEQNQPPQTLQKASENAAPKNSQNYAVLEKEPIVSDRNFHIELRFRPGTLSTASLVQLDLSEVSKEDWLMSRPVFHENKEVSLYFLKCGRSLRLVDTDVTSFTLRGFAANSAGGSRGTNVMINYDKFNPVGDPVSLSGTKALNITILGHRGQRKAPLAICFANQNTILNNGELLKDSLNDIELQITNIGGEAIALSSRTEFTIEIDGQADGKNEPWAVAKKDEVANFNIAVKRRGIQGSNDQYWCWNVNSSAIDKNTEEPRFTFRDIYRQIGSKQAIESLVVKHSPELAFPKNLQEKTIKFMSHPEQVQVAYPGTVWKNGDGYSLWFQEDGNLVLYNSSEKALWATGTYPIEHRADTLKFHPSGNLVLYKAGQPIWSTQTQGAKNSQVCLELRQDGNLVIYDVTNPAQFLFQTGTKDGTRSASNAVSSWTRKPIDIEEKSSSQSETPAVSELEYSFPSNDDLIFVLSNVKSSLASGQGQIRFYYKNIPGYADGYQILNLYKTHLIERNKKIGIGKVPETELDVKGTVTATSFVGQGAIVQGMIVMWYGEYDKVPKGWALCDGSNNTPDLRERFVIGARDKQKGSIGGNASVTLSIDNMPAHNHSGTTNNSGNHYHNYRTAELSAEDHRKSTDDQRWSWKYKDTTTEYGGEHKHNFETDSKGGGQSFSILPPYCALFFIMKL